MQGSGSGKQDMRSNAMQTCCDGDAAETRRRVSLDGYVLARRLAWSSCSPDSEDGDSRGCSSCRSRSPLAQHLDASLVLTQCFLRRAKCCRAVCLRLLQTQEPVICALRALRCEFADLCDIRSHQSFKFLFAEPGFMETARASRISLLAKNNSRSIHQEKGS